MPRKALLTNEEKLERKRNAERLRMNKIRSDPLQYTQWIIKRRKTYFEKQKSKRQTVFKNLSQEFTEKDDQINESYDPLDERSHDITLANLTSSRHGDDTETLDKEADIETAKPLPSAYFMEHSHQDIAIKVEPGSPDYSEPLIPQISLHECSEPLAINNIPESSSTQSKVSNEVPWSLFREFECSIKKELDSKDKIIEELTLLNIKYKKQVNLLIEEKIKSENSFIRCPHCDRKIEENI